MNPTEERTLPQLVMRRSDLSDLPDMAESQLPSGFHLRSYEAGDDAAWESIIRRAFGWERNFGREIAGHACFKPERVLFICAGAAPVATACAWHEPGWGTDSGYLHMVAVDPDYAGMGLGYAVSLAALRQMRAEGRRQAVLETDDFRLPAIVTYFKLGFQPEARDEVQRERWKKVCQTLNYPFMQAETRPGNPAIPNEDALVIHPSGRVYSVIDGVSAIDAYRGESEQSGGYIASRLLAAELLAADPRADLRETVLRANSLLLERMREAGVETANAAARWGAVFAVVKVHSGYFEFVQSGDCMILVRYRDGSVRTVTRNQVAGLDLETLHAKRELEEAGTWTKAEISQMLRPYSERNRQKANTLEGYSVMNGDPALESFMESGRISLAGVLKIYLVSDGMYHFIENSPDPEKWRKLADRLDALGIGPYIDDLCAQEALDPSCERHPRHKVSDDKSAVILDVV
ncbi:GNAT family N-acetyltransferase [Paenibacillus macerans]|uniref:Acetyltransferase family protein n=1 Tax=Paenibacillus macerans TaxID=44252 RepID=A0A090ZNF6_PAEMA|nr:GNAT family N-acetyltransferase [Paenibacillus macerans]KFN11958.1 acetyltransferase family protein [Paenibacillus macerans]MCY7562294.1 GNAT family N-acetyltransferase [Paenibacillus macerans]MEC0151348.1 GNAT family N-acetyltransferase [Paenibacillus macerans]SUA86269.1 mycothiol synthase [Paenibacillus macerans]